MNKNSWEFHLTNKIAQLSRVTLEIHTEFWLGTLQTWFRGYQTPKELKTKIFGKEVDLYISITPLEAPTETFPVFDESSKEKKAQLPPEWQTYLAELKKKVKALQKRLPPRIDEALEQRYLNEMNADRLREIVQVCTRIWSNPDLFIEEKLALLIPYKIELYELVCVIQLPDDLMRTDTDISILMATIQYFAQAVVKNARKKKIKIPRQVHQLVKSTDDLITRMNERQNKLNGVERDMTSKELDSYLDMMHKAGSPHRPIEERLELYEQLWETPSVSTGSKIGFMNEAIKLVKKQYCKDSEIHCPHTYLIRKHLKAISGYRKELEKEGKEVWQLRMADELLPAANAWRENCELQPLSSKEFAYQIELQSVHIETKEKDDGSIHYELELFFQDTDDTFAGHFMYADFEDHKVKEITLMG